MTQRDSTDQINGKRLRGTTRALLRTLAANASGDGVISISRKSLMDELGICERTLDTHMSALYKAGLVSREMNQAGGWVRRLHLSPASPASPAPTVEPAAPEAPALPPPSSYIWADAVHRLIKRAIEELDEWQDAKIEHPCLKDYRRYVEEKIKKTFPDTTFVFEDCKPDGMKLEMTLPIKVPVSLSRRP
jgi:DNA-binding transcriptional ArsR family regulator